jgi:hypothetical protein
MSRSLFNPIEKAFNRLKNITQNETIKLIPDLSESKNYIKNILTEPTVAAMPDDLEVLNAEECFELPPVRQLSDDVDELRLRSLVPFIEIQSDVTSDQIVDPPRNQNNIIHSTRKYKKNNIVMISDSLENPETDRNDSPKKIKPDIMNVSYCAPPR